MNDLSRRTLGIFLLVCAIGGTAVVGCGGDSNDSGDGTLAAPVELKAEVVPGPAVHVTWKDIANEHHYVVERKAPSDSAFKDLGTTVFNVLQYHDADVEVGKSYVYRVAGGKADNTKGPYSAEVTTAVHE
jgi:hypothetical protein